MREHVHKSRRQTRRGYVVNPNHWRCVADAVVQERFVCRRWRCDEKTEWETVSERCIQSLTMDAISMDRLHERGELWR